MRRPSTRAMVLLRLVAYETRVDRDGLAHHFYAGTGYESRHRTIPRIALDGPCPAERVGTSHEGDLEVYLSGSGDVAALRGLERRGLIAVVPGSSLDLHFGVTDAGRTLVAVERERRA